MGRFNKIPLIKLIPFMVRQAHHERNQPFAVRPELVEGLIQIFLKKRRFVQWLQDAVNKGRAWVESLGLRFVA
jgi:glycerol-3-phosphate dehydrogenase (NAD(P)+)